MSLATLKEAAVAAGLSNSDVNQYGPRTKKSTYIVALVNSRKTQRDNASPKRTAEGPRERRLKKRAAMQPAGNETLKALLQNNVQQAWSMFYAKTGSGNQSLQFNASDCAMMMQACYTTEQMKELVDAMQKGGVALNAATYNTYVRALVVEGNVAEAKRVVNEDMKRKGVHPNHHTRLALTLPASNLNRIRSTTLKQWLKEGGDDAMAAAWKLFDELVERGVADVFHFSIMLKACHDTKQMKELMDNSMQQVGVVPDVAIYTTYVVRLMIEHNATEAKKVVYTDMKRMGVQPNHRTHDALKLQAHDLKQMRGATLG